MIKFLQTWYQLRVEFLKFKTECQCKLAAYKTDLEIKKMKITIEDAKKYDDYHTENVLKLLQQSNK